jgi:hypothetical protein
MRTTIHQSHNVQLALLDRAADTLTPVSLLRLLKDWSAAFS